MAHPVPPGTLRALAFTSPNEESQRRTRLAWSSTPRLALLTCAATAGLLVLSPAAPARSAGIEPAAGALAALDDAWSRSAATKDAAKVAAYFAADAIAYPPDAPMVTGREAARKVWESCFALPGSAISWTTLHAGVSKGGDLGFTTGSYEDSYRGTDGKTVGEKGKYVRVWRKQKDGHWKAIHDTWNADAK